MSAPSARTAATAARQPWACGAATTAWQIVRGDNRDKSGLTAIFSATKAAMHLISPTTQNASHSRLSASQMANSPRKLGGRHQGGRGTVPRRTRPARRQ